MLTILDDPLVSFFNKSIVVYVVYWGQIIVARIPSLAFSGLGR